MPSLSTLLTNPDAFFRVRNDDPSLKGPVGVVVLVAVVSAVAATLQFRLMSEMFAGMAGGSFVQAVQAISIVTTLVGPFFVWLLYAVVFYAISLVFDGDGEFTTTLALVGWGFVPSVFGSVARTAIDYYRFEVRGVDVPAEITQESMRQFQQQIQTGPLVLLATGLGIIFTLWSALLWTFAMKHARDLSEREAALTIALPVLASLALSAWSLLSAL